MKRAQAQHAAIAASQYERWRMTKAAEGEARKVLNEFRAQRAVVFKRCL
jgi:hypothetical protein